MLRLLEIAGIFLAVLGPVLAGGDDWTCGKNKGNCPDGYLLLQCLWMVASFELNAVVSMYLFYHQWQRQRLLLERLSTAVREVSSIPIIEDIYRSTYAIFLCSGKDVA